MVCIPIHWGGILHNPDPSGRIPMIHRTSAPFPTKPGTACRISQAIQARPPTLLTACAIMRETE